MPITAPPPRPTRLRVVRRFAIEAVLVLAIVFAVGWWRTRDAMHGVAPELSGPALNQPSISLAALRGEPVVVYFWATWCGVCKTMRGTMGGLASDHHVVTVASQSGDRAAVDKYLHENGVSTPTVLDDRGEIAKTWGVSAFPTIYVLDSTGKVRFVEVGWTSSIGLRLRLWWAGLT